MNLFRTRPGNRTARGFNLIEVVVALAVTSVGIISILGLLPFGLTAARTAGDRTVAAMIAQDIIANLRAEPYPPGAVGPYYFDQSGFSVADSDPTRYFIVPRVTPADRSGIVGLKALRVDVAWPALQTDDSKRERLVFVTAIANRDN